MGIELVTGFTGKAHISSLDVAKFNAGAFGSGEYVFAGVKDDKLKATMASSNKVHISSGNAMMQGRHFWVDAAGVDLTVQTGTQSQKRNDLVVARYAKNASTGVESVSLVVIKGTPTTGTPADPSYTRGDILNGNALANDMPQGFSAKQGRFRHHDVAEGSLCSRPSRVFFGVAFRIPGSGSCTRYRHGKGSVRPVRDARRRLRERLRHVDRNVRSQAMRHTRDSEAAKLAASANQRRQR